MSDDYRLTGLICKCCGHSLRTNLAEFLCVNPYCSRNNAALPQQDEGMTEDRRFSSFWLTHKEPTKAADYILELEAKLAAAEEALESIVEYWNRDQNEEAMVDALAYIIAIAEEAIDAARGEV